MKTTLISKPEIISTRAALCDSTLPFLMEFDSIQERLNTLSKGMRVTDENLAILFSQEEIGRLYELGFQKGRYVVELYLAFYATCLLHEFSPMRERMKDFKDRLETRSASILSQDGYCSSYRICESYAELEPQIAIIQGKGIQFSIAAVSGTISAKIFNEKALLLRLPVSFEQDCHTQELLSDACVKIIRSLILSFMEKNHPYLFLKLPFRPLSKAELRITSREDFCIQYRVRSLTSRMCEDTITAEEFDEKALKIGSTLRFAQVKQRCNFESEKLSTTCVKIILLIAGAREHVFLDSSDLDDFELDTVGIVDPILTFGFLSELIEYFHRDLLYIDSFGERINQLVDSLAQNISLWGGDEITQAFPLIGRLQMNLIARGLRVAEGTNKEPDAQMQDSSDDVCVEYSNFFKSPQEGRNLRMLTETLASETAPQTGELRSHCSSPRI